MELSEALSRFTHDDQLKIQWLIEHGLKWKFKKYFTRKHYDAGKNGIEFSFTKPGIRLVVRSNLKRNEKDPVSDGRILVFLRATSGGYVKTREIPMKRIGLGTEVLKKFVDTLEPSKKDPNYKPKELEVREFKDEGDHVEIIYTHIGGGQFHVYYIEDDIVKRDSYANARLAHPFFSFEKWVPNPPGRVITVASRDGKRLYESKNTDPNAKPFFVLNIQDHNVAVTSEVENYWELTTKGYKEGEREFNMIIDSKKSILHTRDRDTIKILIFRYMENM